MYWNTVYNLEKNILIIEKVVKRWLCFNGNMSLFSIYDESIMIIVDIWFVIELIAKFKSHVIFTSIFNSVWFQLQNSRNFFRRCTLHTKSNKLIQIPTRFIASYGYHDFTWPDRMPILYNRMFMYFYVVDSILNLIRITVSNRGFQR